MSEWLPRDRYEAFQDMPIPHYEVDGQPWEIANSMLNGLPLALAGERYYTADPGRETIATAMSEVLHRYATPAFREMDEPSIIIPTPVATHQESMSIGPTLEHYRRQRDAPPFQVVLYCNWVRGANDRLVSDTIGTVNRFQRDHPEVPVGYFVTELPRPLPMGSLRRLLWDAALFRPAHSDRTDDIVMLNHDADITHMDPRHLAELYGAMQPASSLSVPTMAYPRGSHERSGGQLPNMDSAAAWFDLRTLFTEHYYEMGVAISARAYMAANGFDPEKTTGEMIDLIGRIHQGRYLGHPGITYVPWTRIRSSPRRIYHHMAAGRDDVAFWSEFGPDDAYRVITTSDLDDISIEQRDRMIRDIVIGSSQNLLGTAEHLGLNWRDKSPAAARHYARTLINCGRLILGGPADLASEANAELARAACAVLQQSAEENDQ